MSPQTHERAGRLRHRRLRAPEEVRGHGRGLHDLRQVLVVVVAVGAAAATGAVPLAALVAVGLIAAVLVAARPGVAALVAVGLLYSNAVVIAVNSHGAPGAMAAMVPLLFMVTVSFRIFARREPFVLPRPGLWVVALLLAQALGAMSSRDPISSVGTWQASLLEGLLLFLLVTNAIRGYEMIRMAALVLVIAAAALGTLTLVQDVTGAKGDFGGFATKSKAVVGQDSSGNGSSRHAGPIGEQNRWAQSLAVVLPLAIGLALTDRVRAVRLTARIAIPGILVGIVLTYSRGAVVGLVLTGLVALALRWVRVKVAVAVAAVAIIALGALAPVYVTRASTVVNAGSSVSGSASAQADGSISNRTTEAYAAIAVFSRHPIIGVGVGLFPTYFQDEARKQGAARIVGVNREAHDLYLGIAAESGLLGLMAFAGLSGSILSSLATVRRRAQGIRDDVAGLATGFALAFVTYLTTGIFLHFAYIRYFWMLAALAAAMGMVKVVAPGANPAFEGGPANNGTNP